MAWFYFILRNKKLVGTGVLLVAFLALGIRIVQLQRRHVKLQKNLTNTQQELAVSRAIITGYKKDIQQILQINEKYQKTTQELRASEKRLNDTLNRERRQKKSLEQLTKEAPSKIESLINRKTNEVLLDFEGLTQ